MKPPKCSCGGLLELKSVIDMDFYPNLLYFQCKKCGNLYKGKDENIEQIIKYLYD